jgi:hypothetical protein
VETTTTAAPTTTTETVVRETVDVTTALKLAMNETTAMGDVTLSSGVRLQVRVIGEQGAMLRSLGDGGLGVFSPLRDGSDSSNATTGRIRAGLSMVFLFSKDHPVSFKRLVLGSWDASDRAQLTLTNSEFAMDTTTTTSTAATETGTAADSTADATATMSTGGVRKRQQDEQVGAVVLINEADSAFEEETAAGFTRYELAAMGDSDFSVKSFMFTMRVPTSTSAMVSPTETTASDGQRAIGETSVAEGGFVFDTMTIALIAAAGALCLICVIVLIVCLVRRKKNGASGPKSTSGDHFTVQMDEMRPALVMPESSLAHTLTRGDSLQSVQSAKENYHVLAAMPPAVNYNPSQYKMLAIDSYQALPSAPTPGAQPYVVVPSEKSGGDGSQMGEYQAVPQFSTQSSGTGYMPLQNVAAPPIQGGGGTQPLQNVGGGTQALPPYQTLGLSRSPSMASVGKPATLGLPPPPPRAGATSTSGTQELQRGFSRGNL